MYAKKKVLPEPDAMNSLESIKKNDRSMCRNSWDRLDVREVNTGAFIDKTIFNLFLRRSQGRSRKGNFAAANQIPYI